MTYTLTEANEQLGGDGAGGSEAGETYDECVSFHEVIFLEEEGEGPHSVF